MMRLKSTNGIKNDDSTNRAHSNIEKSSVLKSPNDSLYVSVREVKKCLNEFSDVTYSVPLSLRPFITNKKNIRLNPMIQ